MSRLPNVSLRQLEYFIAVAETRSFRRAAEKLHVSQPTLTAQIASMEAALGARLFERNRSGTTQSALGRELLPRARRVIEEYRGLVDSVASLIAGPAGTYRFGVTPTMGPYLLPHVLPDVHREFAAVRFYIREDLPRRLLEGLASGQYDFIIAPLQAEQEDFSVEPLFREELKLVVPSDHRLANRSRITRNDMQGEEILTLQDHDQLHMQIQRLCDHLGARVNRQYEGTSLDTLRQMVTMGMGLAFLPALYIHAEIRAGEGLEVLGLNLQDMHREHVMLWRRTSPSRQLFRDLASRLRAMIAGKLEGVVSVPRD